MENLELVTLPLDMPDDDPRWAGYQDQVNVGFHEEDPSESKRRFFRDCSRADGTRNRGLYDPDDLFDHRPVATLASLDRRLNVGAGRLVPANLVTDVTVRVTHRRRGLLRRMMIHDLSEAQARGAAVSVLTASEGSIYGRFGFGVSCRYMKADIDCGKFALRSEPTGSVAYLPNARIGEVLDPLVDLHVARDRGAVERMAFHRAHATGAFDWDSGEPSTKLRALVHRNEEGRIDGLATYAPVKDSDPGRVSIQHLLAEDGNAERALWATLASLDLVDVLEHDHFSPEPMLQQALVNPRALKPTKVPDMLWVRVLDVVATLSARGWDADGSVVLRVADDLGLIQGTYALTVHDGTATVERTDADPDALVDAETLGSLVLGGVSPAAIAAAGRIGGDADAVARLFTVTTAPFTPVGF